MHAAAWIITDLGDLFVASAAGLVLVIWAWFNLGRMVALAFWTCHAATFGLVTLIKLWTGRHLPEPDQVAPWAPSAGAPSIICAPTMPLAPGRGSINQGWPRSRCMASDTARSMGSLSSRGA